jgi:DNA mismatch endonuclease, patch repair protein
MRTPRLRDVDPARSAQMALVRSKNTKPEIVVRQLVHSLGYRFRLHRRDLPGSPDLVFPRHRKVIFVHGCFWHQHNDPTCWRSRLPKSRQEFWRPKLAANAARDQRDLAALDTAGWAVLVVWECQTAPSKRLTLKLELQDFLSK